MSKNKHQNTKKDIQKPLRVQQDLVLNPDRQSLWFLLAAVGITLVVFFPSLFNGFVLNWDDATYIQENDTIKALSWVNLKTIFTGYVNGNYHPLTILSYALEYAVAGLKPFLYHFDNLILHLLNVALVFVFVRKLTDKLEIAFITALLFGIHPLRVESVAWVSERKDVLYTFFYLLAGITYLDYYQKVKSKALHFTLSVVFIVLSMLSKPAAVCFPGVVVLIDWFLGRKFSISLVLEKIPFFAVSLIFGIVAVYSQRDIGAIQNLGPLFSFFDRILLSFYAIVMYIEKFIVPLGLSAMHPYPEVVGNHLPMKVYIAPIIVLALLIPVFFSFRKTKMIVFGTVFFFINIALVLQLLPVGAAIIAERYSYVPYIGLFMMLGYAYVWVAGNKKEQVKKLKPLIIAVLGAWILFLGITSFNRIKVWKRGDYLFEDILQTYRNQPFVYNNLGFICFNDLKDYDRALLNYNRCIAVDSTFEVVYCNRGILYFNIQKYKEAIKDFDKALKFNPDNANALIGRANTLSSINSYDKALIDYNAFITLITNNPTKYQIASNLVSSYHWRGVAESNLGKNDDAIRDFNKVLESDPNRYETYYWRGLAYNNKKMLPQAIQDLSRAIAIEPSKSEYYAWRGLLYFNVKKVQASIDDYSKAIQLNPKDIASFANRALAYKETKQWDKALADLNIVSKMGYPVQGEYYEEVKRNAKGK